MKKIRRSLFVIALILIPAITSYVLADPPAPPAPGANPSTSGGVPVGAPIDNGIFILLVLGVVYGTCKIFELKKAKSLEEPSK